MSEAVHPLDQFLKARDSNRSRMSELSGIPTSTLLNAVKRDTSVLNLRVNLLWALQVFYEPDLRMDDIMKELLVYEYKNEIGDDGMETNNQNTQVYKKLKNDGTKLRDAYATNKRKVAQLDTMFRKLMQVRKFEKKDDFIALIIQCHDYVRMEVPAELALMNDRKTFEEYSASFMMGLPGAIEKLEGGKGAKKNLKKEVDKIPKRGYNKVIRNPQKGNEEENNMYKNYVEKTKQNGEFLVNLGDYTLYQLNKNEVVKVYHENTINWKQDRDTSSYLSDAKMAELKAFIAQYEDASDSDEADSIQQDIEYLL
ncbi:hypothetical protein HCC36_11095 [Listeria booriae]|uniref:Uncharacterized protein n=1 Tax=Listeria booriae TaxID=1552123 RepID=A0A842FY67_9LIST|nr:hypothetical protein [Listeria booriae]MBC2293775.1 hypothetical protein [Listeria booriae]